MPFMILLLLLLLPFSAIAQLRSDPINPIPTTPWAAAAPGQVRTWQLYEAASTHGKIFTPFVVSGGNHATSASLTSAAFATEAFVPERVNQAATAITYAASANDTCWTILSSQNTTITAWTRVGTTAYYYQCQGNTVPLQPTLPSNSAFLMRVDITSSAIVLVNDYRNTDPVRSLLNTELKTVLVPQYASAGAGTAGNPWTGWDTRINWALEGQLVQFPAGHYKLTAPIAIKGPRIHIQGAGKQVSVIHYAPTADAPTLAGIANAGVFHFATGINAVLYQNSIRNLSILTSDTTFRKVGINLVDVSEFYMADVTIGLSGAWTGNTSRGLLIQGRELSTIERIDINGDIPLQISGNPNSTIDIDQFTFRDTYLTQTASDGGTWPNPVVLVDSGVALSNVNFEGSNSWLHGTAGFKWVESGGATASLNLSIKNVRWEQSTVSTGYIIDIEKAPYLNNVHIENIYGGTGTAHRGFKFRNISGLFLHNLFYAGTAEALNVDVSILGLSLSNCFWQAGSTAVISGQIAMSSISNSAASMPAPSFAVYAPANGVTQMHGQTVWFSSGSLASGAQTGNLTPFGGTYTMATIIVSASGATKHVGGQVVIDATGPTATLISGSALFNVGSVATNFTVLQTGSQIHLLNQLGETANYLIQIVLMP